MDRLWEDFDQTTFAHQIPHCPDCKHTPSPGEAAHCPQLLASGTGRNTQKLVLHGDPFLRGT